MYFIQIKKNKGQKTPSVAEPLQNQQHAYYSCPPFHEMKTAGERKARQVKKWRRKEGEVEWEVT